MTGASSRTFHAAKYAKGGIDARFVQDNQSRSIRSTIRGLHAQQHHPQGKLVRVLTGAVFDVVVDIRRGSANYLRWLAFDLSANNFRQVYVPPGYAHAICVTSEFAEVEYKCTEFYDPGDELRIAWDDPAIGIRWPVESPILSDADRAAERIDRLVDRLTVIPRGRQ
jgi:dTDP-4-dehydrorhamnose 3,5-epimerase